METRISPSVERLVHGTQMIGHSILKSFQVIQRRQTS